MDIFSLFGKIWGRSRIDVKPAHLLIGLGNPGEEYLQTRHNIGFRIIDKLASSLEGKSVERRCESVCMAATLNSGAQVLLIKPLTFMNRSGDAVKACIEEYDVSLGDCLVIVDDFNIPLGSIRFRKEGTHGGHNGLRSIISNVGSQFPRLRVGIGPLPSGVDIISFVLGSFTERENEMVEKVIEGAAKAVLFMLENGIEKTMNKYNSISLLGESGKE